MNEKERYASELRQRAVRDIRWLAEERRDRGELDYARTLNAIANLVEEVDRVAGEDE